MEQPGSTLAPTSTSAGTIVPSLTNDTSDTASPALPRLRQRTKWLYGVGEISNSIKSFTFGLFLLFFYTSVLGLPGTLVGVATAISLVWDALIDPFIGHLSDGFKSRWGRRQPFMLVGTVLMGISFFLIFSPPGGLSAPWLFAWLVGTNILLRTMNSVFMVPYHALGAELSQNYFERTSITGVRAGFALFGTLVAAGLSFAVFFPQTVPGVDPKFNTAGYGNMGLAFGLAITFTGLLATFGTFREGKQSQAIQHAPVTPPAAGKAPDEQAHNNAETMGFFRGLGLALRNRSFLTLTIASALFFLASVVNATVAVHYLTYYARITDSNALSLFQLGFYGGALLGVPVWMRAAHQVSKHHIFIGATFLLALLMGAAYWLVGEGRLLGVGNALPLIIANTLGGFIASAIWVTPSSMMADVVDEDELRSGRRREGTFFGIHSFFQQEAASIAILVSGFLLDYFAFLIPGQVEQSALTTDRIGMLYSLLPALLFVIAAALMLRYTLTAEKVAAVQAKLAQVR